MNIRDALLVASGGAVGALARYATHLACVATLGARFPWGTLLVNVLGCFLLGWLFQYSANSNVISEGAKLFLGVGFLGAFTTFSTFGVQSMDLWTRSPAAAAANVGANVVVGLFAVVLGMHWASAISTPS